MFGRLYAPMTYLLIFLFLLSSFLLVKCSQCNDDHESIRFCSIGMGVFGRIIAKVALDKGFKLVSAFTRNSHHNKTVAELLGMNDDESLSFHVSDIRNLEDVIDETNPHFCIDATDSTLHAVYPHFARLIEKKVHILTLADDAIYPDTTLDMESYQLFQSLHHLAAQNGVVILGGGYSDSIFFPVIPSIAASMHSLTKIHLAQKENVDDWGDFAHHAQQYGVAFTQKEFEVAFDNNMDTGIEKWQRRIVESIADGINGQIMQMNTWKECYVVKNTNGFYSRVMNQTIASGDCAGMNTTIFAKTTNQIEIVFSVIFAVIPNIDQVNDIECMFFGTSDTQYSIKNVNGKVTTAASLIHRARTVLDELTPGFYNVARLKSNKYWKHVSDHRVCHDH
eukprot:399093_1